MKEVEEKRMEKKINLRFGTEEDCKKIYDWRNHPKIREISFSSEEIIFADHEKWFYDMIKNPKRTLFIIMNEKSKDIGNVRIDKKEGYALINILIDGNFINKGKGTLALKKSAEVYFNNFDVPYIVAEIRKDNIASIKSFVKAGYKLYKEHKDKYEYRIYKNEMTKHTKECIKAKKKWDEAWEKWDKAWEKYLEAKEKCPSEEHE